MLARTSGDQDAVGAAHVYREILETSRRHAGQAGFSQYFAYWHHRCHEAAHGWPRWLRGLPRAELWLALVHSRWHRHQGRLLPLTADLLTAVGRRVLRRPPVERVPALPNGWLAPECTIDRPRGDVFRLVGSAPKDGVLTVSTGGNVLATLPLQAHCEEVIEVPLPAACGACG